MSLINISIQNMLDTKRIIKTKDKDNKAEDNEEDNMDETLKNIYGFGGY